jgi:hypothetical protein
VFIRRPYSRCATGDIIVLIGPTPGSIRFRWGYSMKAVLAALALVTVASSAALAQPMPIPPPQAELGPPPPPPGPGPGFVIEPGHWRWNGVRYVWIGRHWIHARPAYVHFIPGHWSNPAFGPPRWIPEHWGR